MKRSRVGNIHDPAYGLPTRSDLDQWEPNGLPHNLSMPPKLETLLQYARAERFIPFTVVLSSGTTYSIPNRDQISIPPPEQTEGGDEYADYFLVLLPKSHRIVWLDSLVALEAKGALN